jgi:RNA-binding protein
VIRAIDAGLLKHELIKIKFIDFKEKEQKEAMTEEFSGRTGGEPVGRIGHTVILYRQQADPDKRKITVPERE